MTTLTVMKSRMVSELANRTDLSDAIANAISDAIAEYQGRRFWFNQARSSFSTADGTEYYSTSVIPTDIAQIDSLRLTANGDIYVMHEMPWQWMEDISTTTEGRPTRWAFYGQQIRLYPIPDAVYTVSIAYHKKVAAPAADGEADNPWMTYAEELIRSAALMRVYMNNLLNPAMAGAHGSRADRAYARLIRESHKLESGGLVGSM